MINKILTIKEFHEAVDKEYELFLVENAKATELASELIKRFDNSRLINNDGRKITISSSELSLIVKFMRLSDD